MSRHFQGVGQTVNQQAVKLTYCACAFDLQSMGQEQKLVTVKRSRPILILAVKINILTPVVAVHVAPIEVTTPCDELYFCTSITLCVHTCILSLH